MTNSLSINQNGTLVNTWQRFKQPTSPFIDMFESDNTFKRMYLSLDDIKALLRVG
jgi:hypothetical protein